MHDLALVIMCFVAWMVGVFQQGVWSDFQSTRGGDEVALMHGVSFVVGVAICVFLGSIARHGL